MKQSTTSTSSAGIAVDSEESKAIDDVTVIEERNVVNDVVAVIEAPAEDITLDLDSEELHYLCQETNRPTLGVNWDYLGWVYRSSYSYSSTLPYFILRDKALPCVRAYNSTHSLITLFSANNTARRLEHYGLRRSGFPTTLH